LKWIQTFPLEFYKEIFRLKKWAWNNGKMPGVVGKYTNDLVYARLAPGVLDELKRLNPPSEKGYRKYRHHQYLTRDVGHPALSRHLYELLGMMRASETWEKFYRVAQRTFPKINTNFTLPFPEEDEPESVIA
jgi:P63C domain